MTVKFFVISKIFLIRKKSSLSNLVAIHTLGTIKNLLLRWKKLESNLHRCKEIKDDEILRPEIEIIRCCQKFSLGLKNKTSFFIQSYNRTVI